MSRPDDDGLLSRWSARKLKARAASVSEPASEAPDAQVPPADAAPEQTDAEILDELGLPDPESLVKGDDFKAFLRAGIPARLRARALRRLWLSDPVLANLDGLNDYEQDFTDNATVRPDLKTAYRVGKGFLRQAPEAAAVEDADQPPASAEPPAEVIASGTTTSERPAPAADEAPDPSEEGARPAAEPAGTAAPPAVAEAAADPPRRAPRMRFRFESG